MSSIAIDEVLLVGIAAEVLETAIDGRSGNAGGPSIRRQSRRRFLFRSKLADVTVPSGAAEFSRNWLRAMNRTPTSASRRKWIQAVNHCHLSFFCSKTFSLFFGTPSVLQGRVSIRLSHQLRTEPRTSNFVTAIDARPFVLRSVELDTCMLGQNRPSSAARGNAHHGAIVRRTICVRQSLPIARQATGASDQEPVACLALGRCAGP